MLYIGIVIGFAIGFILVIFFQIRQIKYEDFERLLKERENKTIKREKEDIRLKHFKIKNTVVPLYSNRTKLNFHLASIKEVYIREYLDKVLSEMNDKEIDLKLKEVKKLYPIPDSI